ncbi:Protein-serine/threonine kinase [Batrachochytrium dendrobatidis]
MMGCDATFAARHLTARTSRPSTLSCSTYTVLHSSSSPSLQSRSSLKPLSSRHPSLASASITTRVLSSNTVIPRCSSLYTQSSACTHRPLLQQNRCFVSASSASHSNFYHNRVLEKYVEQEVKRVTLRQLSVFGRNFNLEKVLRSANYIRTELSVRLAHRISRFQQLPFVVGTNPHIEFIYNLYWEAFETFRSMAPITTIEQNRELCAIVQSLLNAHLVAIPELALGIAQSEQHMTTQAADKFINETLRSRIGRRVLAEQHIALSQVFDGTKEAQPDWIGIVNINCHARAAVDKCASLAGKLFRQAYNIEPPEVIIDGFEDATFTYIPDHIEYILFELIKNSIRFTAKKHAKHLSLQPQAPLLSETNLQSAKEIVEKDNFSQPEQKSSEIKSEVAPSIVPVPTQAKLPPVRVTIGKSDTHIMFRISDQGGGIKQSSLPKVWSYLNDSSKKRYLEFDKLPIISQATKTESVSILPSCALHLGLGLPMSRVYANYWGGNISMYSMEGYGTDVYVSISIGNQCENLFDEVPTDV